MEELWRICGPKFCAGFIVRNGKIVYSAPVLWRLRGKTVYDAMRQWKGYTVKQVVKEGRTDE
jgi:hypothetical protein